MTDPVETLISRGREAFHQGDGAASRRAFEAALADHPRGEVFEGLARALYLEVDYQGSIAAHEQAYTAYRQEGNALGAARVARLLAWVHGHLFGDPAVANGWLARARSLLEQTGADSPEYGWVEILQGSSETDAERREEHFRAALVISRRFDDVDLQFEAHTWLGLELVKVNRVKEGMLLLDEALAAVCAGEVQDLYVAESAFCAMFNACERVHDITRAEQWIRAAADVVTRRHLVPIGASCRAHYGGILTAAGRWGQAEVELTEATRILEGSFTTFRSDALARLADLRVRQGRLEEAAQLLDGLDQHPDAVRPLAALWLARGEVALARDLLEQTLARSPQETAAGPIAALLVDAQLAEGTVEDAARTVQQLTDLAERHPGEYLRACAALARGKVCIASGAGDARACLHEALTEFALAGMPIELAQTRLELAKWASSERPQLAVAEARAALEAFERLESSRDADAAASLLRSLGASGRTGPRGRPGLTKREAEVLDLLGHGLSNPEIADRLYISGKTAEHHVGRILSKLGLRNRAEAAAYTARAATRQDRA